MSILIPNTFANKTTAQMVELDENFNEIKEKVDPVIDKLTVDSFGNVGIDKSIPSFKLDVNGSVAVGTGTITFPTTNTGTGYFARGGTSNGGWLVQDGNGRLNQYWNAYTDSGGYKYTVTNEPSARYQMHVNGTTGGTHSWFGAPAGTAGTTLTWSALGQLISGTGGSVWFSPRGTSTDFIINDAGNIGMGGNPISKLDVQGATSETYTAIAVRNPSGVNAQWDANGNFESSLRTVSNHPLAFYTNNTEAMRVKTNGQLATIVTGGTAVMDTYGCRAWVNFQGNANGTFAGGTSTVSRTAGSTTATVTTTNNHGLITGNTVFALTGVVVGSYTVTVTGNTTFTITTVATTVLTNASITFAVNLIRASGNVSSITDNGVGDYTINFTNAMPDANYAPITSMGQGFNPGSTNDNDAYVNLGEHTIQSLRIYVEGANDTALDRVFVAIAIFR